MAPRKKRAVKKVNSATRTAKFKSVERDNPKTKSQHIPAELESTVEILTKKQLVIFTRAAAAKERRADVKTVRFIASIMDKLLSAEQEFAISSEALSYLVGVYTDRLASRAKRGALLAELEHLDNEAIAFNKRLQVEISEPVASGISVLDKESAKRLVAACLLGKPRRFTLPRRS